MSDLTPIVDGLDLASLAELLPGFGKSLVAAFKLARHFATINDRRVTKEFREAIDGITVESAAKLDKLEQVVMTLHTMVVRHEQWKDEPPHTWPTAEDVVDRFVDYARAHAQADGHGKRRMLWHALFSSFDPKFYKSGMAAHLWRIAKELEYPDAAFLAKMIRSAKWTRAADTSLDRWLAHRLVNLGLAAFDNSGGAPPAQVTELGHLLSDFVWDEDMANLDSEPKPLV